MTARVRPSVTELEASLAFVSREVGEGARTLLAKERSRATLLAVVDHTFAYEAKAKNALVARLVRGTKSLPVCAPGCAWCCHLSVFASVPEILRIAEHLRAASSARAFAEARERVRASAAIVAPMSKPERAQAKHACPLLDREKGRCGVYEVRPLSCRAYNSCDAAVCERAFEQALVAWDLPIEITQYTVGRHVKSGLMAGALAVGLDPGPYELAVGLSIALELPDAEERWLRGEAVFAAAESALGREMRAAWDEHHARLASDLAEPAR